MAKKTAVVDLGSNSIRMVIFEKTLDMVFIQLANTNAK